MSTDNLWPEDIGEVNIKAPVTLLREQAALLGARTRNIVEASVDTFGDFLEELQEPFNYELFIVAKPLNNYRYGLFYISHGFDLYPVTIHTSDETFRELGFQGDNHGIAVSDEDHFKDMLAKILSSKKHDK